MTLQISIEAKFVETPTKFATADDLLIQFRVFITKHAIEYSSEQTKEQLQQQKLPGHFFAHTKKQQEPRTHQFLRLFVRLGLIDQ
jgi:hypothetical protein